MGFFKNDKKCQSLKIWSRGELTSEMANFGVSVFHQFNEDLVNGNCSASGCGFFNSKKKMSAFAKKTPGGLASIMVSVEE